MRSPRRSIAVVHVALAFASLAWACAGDDGEGSGTTVGTGSATDDTAPTTAPSSTVADTSTATASDSGTPGCGNGVLEGDEQCDDGDANSDSMPDACRTDCRTAHCADGVIDLGAGEQCDDGNQNSNKPDACRVTCLLPSCGDGVKDLGEPCDDGNELWGDTCYACSDRYYFILNSPDLSGEGEVSILRRTRDGAPVTIVGDDPSFAGIRQLALGAQGARLFALQSQDGIDRVLAFDPVDGAVLEEYPLGDGELGYDPELQAMARASDGRLWIAALGMGTTRMVYVDVEAGVTAEAADLGQDLGVVDMVADDASAVYLSTGSGGTIVRVDIIGLTMSTFADGGDGLSTPIGLAYDPVQGELWVANNPAGAPSQMLRGDLAGNFMAYSTAGTEVAPHVRGVAIDIGGVVLTTQREYDRVVAVQLFDAVQEFATRQIVAPTDLEILDMAP